MQFSHLITLLSAAILVHAVTPGRTAADEPDIVVSNFESETYGDWKATGKAFGDGPARGTLPGQMHVEGFLGKRLVNSFTGGDDSTGTLTSPEFTIERKHLSFLIGGGNHPGKTCINLLIDGKTVRTASGPNSAPGGSERVEWHSWDVADLAGKKAIIEIIDNQKGGWGHVNIDEIIQTNRRRGTSRQTREIAATKQYLHLPVKTGAAKRVMRVRDGGAIVREFEIELAESKNETDFVAFLDLSPWKDKKLLVETTLPAESKALDIISVADTIPAADRLYQEKHRPQFHFTSRRGWLNDPNGMVYLDGEYHLFYQHNPYGWNWGNMHWGHAVSRDLVHWKELPIALYPYKYGDWAFSGSAVIDKQNTSGFKSGDVDVMVAAYTSTGRGECIVYSNDRGRTWQEYEKNPVVKHTGRDPRLLWHEPTKRWVMAVYNEDGGRSIKFHTSPDLKTWKYESKVDNFFECPDLVEMSVDGDKANKKWILYGADGEYLIGHFDGREFKKESGKHRLWHGNFYAAQTFTNTPDGRVIQIGWGREITFPGMPFNQQMCVPVELTLQTTKHGVRLFALPVKEVARLAKETPRRISRKIDAGEDGLKDVPGELIDVTLALDVEGTDGFDLGLRGAKFVFDKANDTLTYQGVKIPAGAAMTRLDLRILVDRGSIEIFTGNGRAAASVAFRPSQEAIGLSLVPRGGPVSADITAGELRSAWNANAPPADRSSGIRGKERFDNPADVAALEELVSESSGCEISFDDRGNVKRLVFDRGPRESWSHAFISRLIGAGQETMPTLFPDDRLKHLPGLVAIRELKLEGRGILPADVQAVSSLTTLEKLSLSDASIDKTDLKKIENLTNLRTLDLSETRIDTLRSLRRLTSLESLDVSDTRLTDAGLAELDRHPALKTLRLIDAPATGKGLAGLKQSAKLETLFLGGSTVNDDGANSAGKFRRLRELSLSNTSVTNDGLSHLKNLTELESLSLFGTAITDEGLAHLAPLKKLRTLSLYGVKVTDDGLKHLASLNELRVLDLWSTQIQGPGLAHLAGLTRLEDLSLGYTKVDDDSLRWIAGLREIKRLQLSDSRVTDKGLSHLKDLQKIEVLTLTSTNVGDEGMAHLGGLSRLEDLTLAHTDVGDKGLAHLKSCSQLKSVNINSTPVTTEGVEMLSKAIPGINIWPSP